MSKVLILGHKGMLGNIACTYLSQKGFEVLTTDVRWGDESFKKSILSLSPDYIINCIGLIPQRKPSDEEYKFINTDLPVFLDTLGIKVIHPTTDCEFDGTLPSDQQYPKTHPRTPLDAYGRSKAESSQFLEEHGKNSKIIRTSIIGHDEKTHLGLLDWFLHAEGEVKGFTNHFWNGLTTLQWMKIAEDMLNNWDTYNVLNQFGTTENKSKYEVLLIAKDIYDKQITVIPFEASVYINRCVESDKQIPSLQEQLKELKAYYGK